MASKNRSREYVHDRLYELADKLLKRHNPCAKCWATNCYHEHVTQRCCEGCVYFKKGQGCTVKALYCKLWICGAVTNQAQLRRRLQRLRKIAEKYNLLVARGSREETLEFGEQLNTDPWWLYYATRHHDTLKNREKAHNQLRHGPWWEE